MYTILLTFGFFLLIILGMSVGYIFSKRTIKGSCGGISSLGMKKVCDCETRCKNGWTNKTPQKASALTVNRPASAG